MSFSELLLFDVGYENALVWTKGPAGHLLGSKCHNACLVTFQVDPFLCFWLQKWTPFTGFSLTNVENNTPFSRHSWTSIYNGAYQVGREIPE